MTQSALPIYVQIANDLRSKIQQGVYRAGDKLPSQKQLGEQFGVNRHTVRQAFELLKREGLLRIDRGLGAFISAPPLQYPISKRVRYNESLQAQGRSSHYQLLHAAEVLADGKLAQHLNLQVRDEVAKVELLGLADDRPLIVSSSYFPLAIFPDLLFHLNGHDPLSISQLMSQVYGCDHIRQRTMVSIQPTSPQDAKLLRIPLNQSILLVQAVNVDQTERVIEYTVTRFRGDGVELVFDH